MIFRSKLILRLFTLLFMAVAIGVTYPGYQASAGTTQTCESNCGSIHQTIEQCYQQAICKKNCKMSDCHAQFEALCPWTVGGYLISGCPSCCYDEYQSFLSCKTSADGSYRAAISLCDRLYWEHCPSPE